MKMSPMKTTSLTESSKPNCRASRSRSKQGYVRNLVLLSVAIFTLAASGCADKVQTDYDHNVNFSQFHTYSWGQVQTGDPLYVDRVKNSIDRELQAKGWQLVPSGGDITVFATGKVQNQQYLETTYNNYGGGGWGHGWGWGGWGHGGFLGGGTSTTTVRNSRFGSLVIDLFESSDKKIVWRGIISGTLSESAGHNINDLNRAMAKIFRDFPPRANA